MKWFLAILTVFATCLLLKAGHEEWAGEAVVSSGQGSVVRATKAAHPIEFRNLMNYQWILAGMWAGVAWFTWRLMRKQDSLDVFAPDRPEKSSSEKP